MAETPLQESASESDEIVLRLCGFCGQVWRRRYTARCGMKGQCNAGRGGPCQVTEYRVVAWEEVDPEEPRRG